MSDDLLKLAVEAHGGAQRWEQISRFRTAALDHRRDLGHERQARPAR
jgi:hypothetical protein